MGELFGVEFYGSSVLDQLLVFELLLRALCQRSAGFCCTSNFVKIARTAVLKRYAEIGLATKVGLTIPISCFIS